MNWKGGGRKPYGISSDKCVALRGAAPSEPLFEVYGPLTTSSASLLGMQNLHFNKVPRSPFRSRAR